MQCTGLAFSDQIWCCPNNVKAVHSPNKPKWSLIYQKNVWGFETISLWFCGLMKNISAQWELEKALGSESHDCLLPYNLFKIFTVYVCMLILGSFVRETSMKGLEAAWNVLCFLCNKFVFPKENRHNIAFSFGIWIFLAATIIGRNTVFKLEQFEKRLLGANQRIFLEVKISEWLKWCILVNVTIWNSPFGPCGPELELILYFSNFWRKKIKYFFYFFMPE